MCFSDGRKVSREALRNGELDVILVLNTFRSGTGRKEREYAGDVDGSVRYPREPKARIVFEQILNAPACQTVLQGFNRHHSRALAPSAEEVLVLSA